jgi:Tfp pilus assembly protein PilF/cold shock CspA family protein
MEGTQMASFQKIALFVLFDSIESDLVLHLRDHVGKGAILTEEEAAKAKRILSRQPDVRLDPDDPLDMIHGLDLGQKFELLLRHKSSLPAALSTYFNSVRANVLSSIPVRNAVMHGRPLTIDEYSMGFALAQTLLSKPAYWPTLAKTYAAYSARPEALTTRAIPLLDHPIEYGVLNNLPIPDYEDTGFLRRPELEKELKRKILGRYPVITVQGDGGNGKTALTLHTVWNLVDSDDHDFELILWYSAKTSSLTEKGISEINSAFTDSAVIIGDVAGYDGGDGAPFERLTNLLGEHRVLLIIDNLETVTGGYIEKLASDVPGQSKIVLTSRIPVGGDLPLFVPQFSDTESVTFLRTVASAHGISSLQSKTDSNLLRYCTRLDRKPLLIKWFAMGVKSGASPERIVAEPKEALQFCLANVLERLDKTSLDVITALVSISESISASVIGEITDMVPEEVEGGLAELTRFGLVEFEDLSNSERTFRLRPFVKSYVIRVVSPSREKIKKCQTRFQKVQARFEISRSAQAFDKYNARNHLVRTKGEAVAEGKLRDLTRALFDDKPDAVERGLEELKISDPGYFEIYRFEAFVAYTWGDIPRATDAYEAALEYGEDQPQLHFFYGGMLLRAGQADLASQQFAKALELDPDAAPVLREAARTEMRRSKFDVAKNYLTRAEINRGHSFKERALITDLWVQYYQRYVDYLCRNDAAARADELCGEFFDFLAVQDSHLFDNTIRDHIFKIEQSLQIISKDGRVRSSNYTALRRWIKDELVEAEKIGGGPDGRHIGVLKPLGRKPTFGFIVTREGSEFFVASATVDPETWQWLQDDQAVEFSVRTKTDGRTEAYDIWRLN